MDNNAKQIIWFLEPKDDRGVAFLKIEHNKKDDEMRMWLPAFKKVRRISAKKKGDGVITKLRLSEDRAVNSLTVLVSSRSAPANVFSSAHVQAPLEFRSTLMFSCGRSTG